ncbi:endo alpha-1,4 polygalactosaminidase precursor [Microthyrium microscopicum]|uniref:alpha-galactosidase n=1 Tax=Microthyrium microscopicum TaxID=703497 RepID=A0A6A6UR97_9PEZI|nr:endo alpha-1,4 polygalactosaminidase precursor [Microthyrium microscopicum]
MFTKFALTGLLASGVATAATLPKADVWQPELTPKWQIILSSTLNSASRIVPSDAKVWDLDVFETSASTISKLQDAGSKVICYYSAGTSEEGRNDLGGLTSSDYGKGLPDWPGEKYINIKSDRVWSVMKGRIDMAKEKGCDAVDPDNMDGYSNDNGLGLTQADAIAFVKKQSSYAHSLGMSIGLKNAEEILDQVQDSIEFAVNEECTKTGRCAWYNNLLAAQKPVFHIEYGSKSDSNTYCLKSMSNGNQFATVIKHLSLDGWVVYCDGSEYTSSVADKSVDNGNEIDSGNEDA